ncbi:hypothetical protein V490_09074, partial [Pseudogymnoascus sp. VKM F-3557]
MGGEWAEKYQVSLVSPSVVPNYFPSLRVVEYNISGLDGGVFVEEEGPTATSYRLPGEDDEEDEYEVEDVDTDGEEDETDPHTAGKKHKKKKKKGKKHRKPKHPDLKIPPPPPKGSPPGPAYSPQPLSWTGYTQYFANLTAISEAEAAAEGGGKGDKGKGGKGGKDKPKGDGEFKYEIEYSTINDTKGFALPDLTVRSFLSLAHRIGRAKGGISSFSSMDSLDDEDDVEEQDEDEEERGLVDTVRNWFSAEANEEDVDTQGKKKKKK